MEYLNLADNNISRLPTTIGNLVKLNKIDLSYNNLKEIPDEIINLPHLSTLSIMGNQISSLSDKMMEWYDDDPDSRTIDWEPFDEEENEFEDDENGEDFRFEY